MIPDVGAIIETAMNVAENAQDVFDRAQLDGDFRLEYAAVAPAYGALREQFDIVRQARESVVNSSADLSGASVSPHIAGIMQGVQGVSSRLLGDAAALVSVEKFIAHILEGMCLTVRSAGTSDAEAAAALRRAGG